MLSMTQKGGFSKLEKFLKGAQKLNYPKILDKYGKQGVDALTQATPVKTGKTAASWFYEVVAEDNAYVLEFHNGNVQNGVNVALVINYDHTTPTGGYVRGLEYINPSLESVIQKMKEDLIKEVSFN